MLPPAPKRTIRKLTKRGFTLIELLIVIAIIGVLAAAVFVAVNPAKRTAQAHDAQRKSNLAQIDTALKEYLIDRGTYPVVGPWVCSSGCSSWSFLENALAPYLKIVPKDPKNNYSGGDPTIAGQTGYTYAYYSNGSTFDLITFLEDSTDKDACGNKGLIDYVYSDTPPNPTTYWCAPYTPRIIPERRPDIYLIPQKP